MQAPTHSYLLRLSVLLMSSMACATSQMRPAVNIRVASDTVHLRKFDQGASLDINAFIENQESRPIYLVGCWPGAEREIRDAWAEVFSPVCLQSRTQEIAPGGSNTISVHLYGYTAAQLLPRLDPRAQAGLYRLIFWLTTDPPNARNGVTSPKTVRLTSTTFVVVN